MSDFTLNLHGEVGLVCRVSGNQLICNSPNGYTLYARAADGSRRVLERSSGPASKTISYHLESGESYQIEAR